jgi:hypothetical protein
VQEPVWFDGITPTPGNDDVAFSGVWIPQPYVVNLLYPALQEPVLLGVVEPDLPGGEIIRVPRENAVLVVPRENRYIVVPANPPLVEDPELRNLRIEPRDRRRAER